NPMNLMAKRLHDRSLKVWFEIGRGRGRHQHRNEVFGWIDPDVRSRRTGPPETAIRQPDTRPPGIGDDPYAQTPRGSGSSAGQRVGDVNRLHQLHRTATEQQLRKPVVVLCGAVQPPPATEVHRRVWPRVPLQSVCSDVVTCGEPLLLR